MKRNEGESFAAYKLRRASRDYDFKMREWPQSIEKPTTYRFQAENSNQTELLSEFLSGWQVPTPAAASFDPDPYGC